VVEFDPVSGAFLGNFVTTGSGGVSAPIGVEFGPDNDLYLASLNTDSVKAYDGTTGAFVGDFVAAGSGGLNEPNFMTFAVPEPSALWMMGCGMAAVCIARVRRGRSTRGCR
jgi:hypothetical protein